MKIKGNKLEVGHAIIVGQCDRPEPRLVAMITGESDTGALTATYLGNGDYGSVTVTPGSTPVEHFGVRVETDGEFYQVVHQGESQATYTDEQPRSWQGDASGKARRLSKEGLEAIDQEINRRAAADLLAVHKKLSNAFVMLQGDITTLDVTLTQEDVTALLGTIYAVLEPSVESKNEESFSC